MKPTMNSMRRFIWCIWGASLTATPCVLRSISSIILTPGLCCAPAHYQLLPLCALTSLSTISYIIISYKDEACDYINRFSNLLPLASFCQIVVFVCEMGWLFTRAPANNSLDHLALLDVIGGVSLIISGLCWSLFGATLPNHKLKENVPINIIALVLAASLSFSALSPVFIQVISSFSQNSVSTVAVLCALSGALTWRLCRYCIKLNLNQRLMLAIPSCLFGGLTVASASLDTVSTLLAIWMTTSSTTADNPFDPFFPTLLARTILAICLILTSFLFFRIPHLAVFDGKAPNTDSRLMKLDGADTLSKRQQEVLGLLVQGKSISETAKELNIAIGTVGTHQSRGLARLGLKTVPQLIDMLSEESQRSLISQSSKSFSISKLFFCIIALGYLGFAALPALWSGGNPIAKCLLLTICSSFVALPLPLLFIAGATSSPMAATSRVSLCSMFAALCLGSLSGTYSSTGVPPLSLVIYVALLTAMVLRPLLTNLAMSPHKHNAAEVFRTHAPSFAISLILYGTGALASSQTLSQNSPGLLSFISCIVCLVLTGRTCIIFVLERRHGSNQSLQTIEQESLSFLMSKGLGETEAHVSLLTAQGYTRLQICSMLNIAPGTVNNSRASSYTKLHVHSAQKLKELIEKQAGQNL